MKEKSKFIFDMDGTLYKFDKNTSQTFVASRFGMDIAQNVHTFFMDRFNLSNEQAQVELSRLDSTYNGEVSLGLETEFGINRNEYFAATWNLEPSDYIEKNPNLRGMLEEIRGRIALLTAAPRIWAIKVLAHLEIDDLFENNIVTGDPDERKPNVIVFQRIAERFNTSPSTVFSIGDQEHTDILPAKSIGMQTVRIGSSDTQADYFAEDVETAVRLLKKLGHV